MSSSPQMFLLYFLICFAILSFLPAFGAFMTSLVKFFKILTS